MPLLVIIGWITHHDLTLFFADFEVRIASNEPRSSLLTLCLQTIVLFVSVLLVNFLIQYVAYLLFILAVYLTIHL